MNLKIDENKEPHELIQDWQMIGDNLFTFLRDTLADKGTKANFDGMLQNLEEWRKFKEIFQDFAVNQHEHSKIEPQWDITRGMVWCAKKAADPSFPLPENWLERYLASRVDPSQSITSLRDMPCDADKYGAWALSCIHTFRNPEWKWREVRVGVALYGESEKSPSTVGTLVLEVLEGDAHVFHHPQDILKCYLREKFRKSIAKAWEVARDLVKAEDKETLSDFVVNDNAEICSAELRDAIPMLVHQGYLQSWNNPAKVKRFLRLLKRKLETGKCLLLLDALDEVPMDRRNALSDRFKRSAYPTCPLIATSRIVGYSSPLVDDAKAVEIVPFRPEQIEKYVKIWFTNAADFINDNAVSADSLLRELRNKPQVRGLTQNPLLLSLICSLYQEKELTLPARRCEIYEKAVDYMLDTWRGRNRKQPSRWGVTSKIRLLERLAYQFTYEEKEIFSEGDLYDKIEAYLQDKPVTSFRNATTDELIFELTEEDGIIQKLNREGKEYIFLHRTFQEYLTASYLSRQRNCIDLAKAHFWDFEWHETLSLLARVMADPIPLLRAIMGTKDDIFSSMLLLARQCVAECGENDDSLVTQIIDRVFKLWSHRKLNFIQSIVTLINDVKHEDNQVKFSTSTTLPRIIFNGDSDVYFRLFEAEYNQRRRAFKEMGLAVEDLEQTDNPDVVKVLIDALDNPNSSELVRYVAVETLGEYVTVETLREIGDCLARAIDALLDMLNDPKNSDLRDPIVSALGWLRSPKAVEPLIQTLNSSLLQIRSSDYSEAEAAILSGRIIPFVFPDAPILSHLNGIQSPFGFSRWTGE
ncbi:HEAT repeat domain-containing protein [Candidatus Poribacteria bacterium]|nr:HEAT repeat domain-containing protein [Candidatus Poribacteria bacterium]